PAPPEAADTEVWFDAPDAQCVEPALGWLRTLPVSSGSIGRPGGHVPSAVDRGRGWWMRTSAKSMEALAAAWADRPADVTFVGTPRTRRLLFGATLLRPQLRIAPSGTDWFAIDAEWQQEGLQLDAADLARLRVATTPFVKLSGGWVRREAVQVHDEVAVVLADLGVEIGAGPQSISLWQLAGAAPSSLDALERLGADPAAVEAARTLRARVAAFRGLPAVAPPAGLRATLRPYQARGLDFLSNASSLGIGALLADDMGLGKTVQALAWLQHLRAADASPQPSLVVCPTSVMHNWLREAASFTPDLRVLALERGAARRGLFEAVGEYDLVVTNYALLRRDLDTWRDIPLRALILDEAQQLKNPDSVATHAAMALSARHRVALTGTPLENRALDLWSIVQCVNPGYLGPRAAFEARFDRLDAPPHARTFLAAKLRPILLRRTKAEVASDLPPRIEERIDCEMTREQRLLYVDELRRSRALVESLGATGGLAKHRIHILAALTRLRQICCHPALAGGKRTLASGKFEALFELLDPLLDEGHKVLLFSQFVECLKLLDAALRARGIRRHMLTGASVKRAEIVDAFQRDDQPGVFLISLKAGGTGLNLTAANYVVLFDPWWNPAVEAQAIDRTHRIGQQRTVIAYRLLMRGTIEEKIFELQQRKAALARDVLGEGGFGRALTRGDLDYLFEE
ncbi:MAG: DEAD/DEAH box helicase, partial [bacterium]